MGTHYMDTNCYVKNHLRVDGTTYLFGNSTTYGSATILNGISVGDKYNLDPKICVCNMHGGVKIYGNLVVNGDIEINGNLFVKKNIYYGGKCEKYNI
jgi:hypothetical protein